MSTMLSNLDLLRRVPLFSLLTVAQAEVISGAVIKRRFKRGEALVEQGQKSNALFILLTGRARVVTSDSRGREVILATLGDAGDEHGIQIGARRIDRRRVASGARAEDQHFRVLGSGHGKSLCFAPATWGAVGKAGD